MRQSRRKGPWAIYLASSSKKPRVGIIGKGNVGGALAKGLDRTGYEIRTVGKEPERVKETAQWADLVVLAVPYSERANALQEMGEAARGKILVDVTNAIGEKMRFVGDITHSGAEELQERVPGAHVVKAFNTVFAQNMAGGHVNGERLTLFVAGDDADAKKAVLDLGADLGFDAVDTGPLRNARWLEPLGFLNIQLGHGQGMGADIGFKLVHPGKVEPGQPSVAS